MIALACACLCASANAVEAPSRDGRSGYSIFVVNADGTGRHELRGTHTSAPIVLRSLSPNGRTLAYDLRRTEGGTDLWSIELVSTRGGAPRTLVRLPGASARSPVWSKDGTLVAFDMCCGAGADGIGIAKPDGSNVSTIPYASEPEWLPGRRLAFFAGGDLNTEIAISKPDGSERTSVHHAAPFEEFAELEASPDGQNLAFTSFTEDAQRLYSVGSVGIPLSLISTDGSQYSWSSRNRLVFVTHRGLVSALADGTGRRRYAATRALSPVFPTWSPNGTRIAFVAKSDRLVVMNARTGRRHVVVRNEGAQPVWSRDGRRLYYVAER